MKPIDNEECSMRLYFHCDVGVDCILFKSWKNEYLVTSVILMLMCIVREYVIYAMKYYEIRSLTGRYIPFWPSTKVLDELMNVNPLLLQRGNVPRVHWRNPITLKLRIIDCVLYGISLMLGYGLMLVIMTFNVCLIVVVIVGFCVGRMIFYPQSKVLSKFAVRIESDLNLSDHCHVRS
eukprot:UN13461